jgi:sodium/proline symporter
MKEGMAIGPIYGVVMVLYLLGMFIVGLVARKKMKTADDFWVAGRKLGTLVLFGTFFGTFLSGYSYLGLAGGSYKSGFATWFLGNGTWIGPLIMVITVKYFVRFIGHTIPDIFEARYGVVARPVSAIIAGLGSLAFAGIQIYLLGTIMNRVFGWPLDLAILAAGGVMVLYTVLGGFYAVAWTDCIQTAVMILGMGVAAITVLVNVGGFSGLVSAASKIDPSYVNPYGMFKSPVTLFALALAFGLGNPSQPMYLTRAFAAKNTQSIRLGIGFATIVTLWAMFAGVIIGMGGRVLFGADIKPVDGIFPHAVTQLLHPVVGSVVVAAMVAAIMSTADSLLLVAGTTGAKDFYARFVNPSAGHEKLVRVSRVLVAITGGLAVVIAMWRPSIVLVMGAYVFGGMAAAFFIPLYVGIYWRRPNAAGGVAAMIAGAVGIVFFTLFRIALHPIIMGVLSSLVAFLLFTYATPPQPERVEAFMVRIGRSKTKSSS